MKNLFCSKIQSSQRCKKIFFYSKITPKMLNKTVTYWKMLLNAEKNMFYLRFYPKIARTTVSKIGVKYFYMEKKIK